MRPCRCRQAIRRFAVWRCAGGPPSRAGILPLCKRRIWIAIDRVPLDLIAIPSQALLHQALIAGFVRIGLALRLASGALLDVHLFVGANALVHASDANAPYGGV